jgi:transposase InsO family protein
MGLARSSYYYQPKEKQSEEGLLREMEAVILEFAGYGYRRVTEELHRQGIRVNHKRVLRLMREQNWLCKRKRRFKTTTDSSHNLTVYPNLIKGLRVTGLDQVWLADITYVAVWCDWVYLAAIIDLCSRRAIGYAVDDRMEVSLTLAALQMALSLRVPPPGCIHHSDRGVQYASLDYVAALRQHGFQISMSRKGNPYDNATMESFFKTLKAEEVYLWEYRDLQDVRQRLGRFIGDVYNRKRLHSSLGYRPPVEFEEMLKTLSPSKG